MDALALLCTLHADGPSSLKRLRSRGCADLSTLLSRTPDAVAEDLSIERPAARRLIREARLLADRVGISALEVEEAPPTAEAPAPARALIQDSSQQPASAGGLDSVDRALVERITRPAPTRPGDPSSQPEEPGDLQGPAAAPAAAPAPAEGSAEGSAESMAGSSSESPAEGPTADAGVSASLPDWLEGPAVPHADDPFSVPGADFGPAVFGSEGVPAAVDPAAVDPAAVASAAPAGSAVGQSEGDSSEEPAAEVTFEEAPGEFATAEAVGSEANDAILEDQDVPLEEAGPLVPALEPLAQGLLPGVAALSSDEIAEALDRALPYTDLDQAPAAASPAPRDTAEPRVFGASVFGASVFEDAESEEAAPEGGACEQPVTGGAPDGSVEVSRADLAADSIAESAPEPAAELTAESAAEIAAGPAPEGTGDHREVEDHVVHPWAADLESVEPGRDAEQTPPTTWADVSSSELADVEKDAPVPIPAIAEEVSAASTAALPGMDEALIEDMERLGICSFADLSTAESLALTRGLGVTFAQARRLRFLARRAEAEGEAWPVISSPSTAALESAADQPEEVAAPQLEQAGTEPEASTVPVPETPVLETPAGEVSSVEIPEAGTSVAEVPVAEVPLAEVPLAEVPVAETLDPEPAPFAADIFDDEPRGEGAPALELDVVGDPLEDLPHLVLDAPQSRPFAAEINEQEEVAEVPKPEREPEPESQVEADLEVAREPESASPREAAHLDGAPSFVDQPTPVAELEQQGVRVDPSEVQARPRFGDQFARAAQARRASSKPGKTVLGWNFEIPRPGPETLPLASITANLSADPEKVDGADGGSAPGDADSGGPFADA